MKSPNAEIVTGEQELLPLLVPPLEHAFGGANPTAATKRHARNVTRDILRSLRCNGYWISRIT